MSLIYMNEKITGGNLVIDDTQSSAKSCYSSEKVDSLLENIPTNSGGGASGFEKIDVPKNTMIALDIKEGCYQIITTAKNALNDGKTVIIIYNDGTDTGFTVLGNSSTEINPSKSGNVIRLYCSIDCYAYIQKIG